MLVLAKLSKGEVERYWHEHHRIAYLAEAFSLERATALFGEERVAEYLARCEALSRPCSAEEWSRGRRGEA